MEEGREVIFCSVAQIWKAHFWGELATKKRERKKRKKEKWQHFCLGACPSDRICFLRGGREQEGLHGLERKQNARKARQERLEKREKGRERREQSVKWEKERERKGRRLESG